MRDGQAALPCWFSWVRCIIIIIINKVLIKVTLNKVIAGALYIVICTNSCGLCVCFFSFFVFFALFFVYIGTIYVINK